jgi:hypothetical protein
MEPTTADHGEHGTVCRIVLEYPSTLDKSTGSSPTVLYYLSVTHLLVQFDTTVLGVYVFSTGTKRVTLSSLLKPVQLYSYY